MMRMTDKLAQEKFNGDIKETIKYILWHYKYGELTAFVREWTKEEIIIANELIDAAPVVNKINEEDFVLTKDEVSKAPKNPYKAKVVKQFLALIIVNGGLIALASVLQNNVQVTTGVIEALTKWIPSVFTGVVSMELGPNLIKYFQQKKLLKMSSEELEKYEGKSL